MISHLHSHLLAENESKPPLRGIFIIWKRHRIKQPLPRTGIAGDGDLMAEVVHGQGEIGDVTRKATGVGAEREVENTKGTICHWA